MTTKKKNNLPQVFNFGNNEVRTITNDGQTWFVANDIAEALGYKNQRKALKDHIDTEDVTKRYMLTKTGNKETNCINESGMYSLILSSKKKEAKKFKRWVTSEVLPKIRQTGGYSYEQPLQLDRTQASTARKIIEKFLKDYEDRRAPKGQSINTRRALMQVHSFIREYYNVASYKNLDAGELATLKDSLNNNTKAVLAAVKDLFVIDLKDQNAIYQDENSIRVSGTNGTHNFSMGYVLEQLNKAKNQQSEVLSLSNNQIPHHMEAILKAIQGTLTNCNNQLDMVKSSKLNLDLEDRIKLMKSIAPNLKVCMTNMEVVTQSMFVDNFDAAKNTSAKDVLDNIGYSVL